MCLKYLVYTFKVMYYNINTIVFNIYKLNSYGGYIYIVLQKLLFVKDLCS